MWSRFVTFSGVDIARSWFSSAVFVLVFVERVLLYTAIADEL
jgi:hypothetical protein